MRIAITGANGQLGQALVTALTPNHDVIALDRRSLDLDSPLAIDQLVATGAAYIIHPAAYTNVDGCARDPQQAYRTNCLGTRYVALACQQLDAKLVYISTNEVFSGSATRPYYEYDKTGPINAYGWSKECGEQAVRELLQHFYIVRVAWLFGGPRNFVRTILRLAAERDSLAVVDDEVGCPTYCPDLAEAISDLIQQPAYGTYHLINEGYCSRYDFAREIVRRAGNERLQIKPIKLTDYQRDSTPPPFTALVNACGGALGLTMRPWQDALEAYLKTLRESH